MHGMFENSRPDADAIDRVKEMFIQAFNLSEDTLLSIAELRCHEAGCPPTETLAIARRADGSMVDWRVHNPIEEILSEDVSSLSNSHQAP